MAKVISEGVEGIMDAVLDRFDENFTLAGAAQASVMPLEVTAMPVTGEDKSLVCFLATIRAQALFQWTNPAP